MQEARMGDYYLIRPEDWLFKTSGDVRKARLRADKYEQEHTCLEGAEYEIEEFVWQWVLWQMISKYGYPREWVEKNIRIEETITLGQRRGRMDIWVRNTGKRPNICMETKKRGLDANEFLRAEQQLRERTGYDFERRQFTRWVEAGEILIDGVSQGLESTTIGGRW